MENIRRTVDFYNTQVASFRKSNPTGSAKERNFLAETFIKESQDLKRFQWSRENYQHLAAGREYAMDDNCFTVGVYRPFFKQRLYFNDPINSSVRRFHQIYPYPGAENIGISITGTGSNQPFHTLITDSIPESCLTAVNSEYFPRWRYVEAQGRATTEALNSPSTPDGPELERVSNINPAALAMFREHYNDDGISKDDLFYYVYGVLHSEQYRERYANDLRKRAARIPMAAALPDFQAFAAAGRELAQLHVGYESVEPYPGIVERHRLDFNPDAPDAYRVEKLKYGGQTRSPDKTVIVCNANVTLAGIPGKAHEYKLGSRSALDWLIDCYQVSTNKKSGIVNDPNHWAEEQGNPRYIIDLIKRIATVSVRTVDIAAGLPGLPL